MRVRALTNFGGAWKGRLFFGQEGHELELPDALAEMLIEAGQVEPLARAKIEKKPAQTRRKATKG